MTELLTRFRQYIDSQLEGGSVPMILEEVRLALISEKAAADRYANHVADLNIVIAGLRDEVVPK